MAIGFIATNITTKKIRPDKSLSKSTTPRVRMIQFGDGYQQRLVDGINSNAEEYTVTFNNHTKADADDIDAFFQAQKGVSSFNFTVPDTNSTSTVTATVNGAVSSSKNVTIDAATNNLEISQGATVTWSGSSGTIKVDTIDLTNNLIVLDSAQSISDDTTVTFTNPNEKSIKVICSQWNVNYSNGSYYNINAKFVRVFEP
tara:strand:+ start:23 stop:622 length:600 start_codon:yes stop_codon:yes gene_type:complete